ncbi:MAG: AAA family ATPase, partial [Niameybacter sp.]
MNELLRLAYPVVADDVSDFENEDVDELLNENENKAYTPKPFVITNWTDIIHKVEMQQGYEYTEEQLGAIELSLNSYVMALTGLGGSGKTSTANGICSLFHNYTITACALSGKAAVRITEATGLPASTIHRALGYQNGTFSYNKHNKMPIDILVLDEATMVNGFLFLSVLQACPTGAKVIIMGDVQQLTPIGNCQVFSDILESGMLPVVKLTKPHRQALLSGIIPTSIKVANQELIFNSKFEGNEILGELQDMELDISQTNNNLTDCVISHFQNEMKKHNNILEVQICVPMRLRGDLSCYTLNNKLQDIYNPKFVDTPEIEIVVSQKSKDKDEESKKYVIRKGDKVLNTKNNYKCVTVDGDTCAVFNGNIGIVEDITKDGYCTIDFIGIGQVVFKKAECKNLEL